jgi:hypothetical protein
MEFHISVRSSDPNVADEIAQTKIEGVTIKQLETNRIMEILHPPIDFVVYIGEHVALPIAASLIARFLYDKLKRRKDNQLQINYQPVKVNAHSIEQVIINLKEDDT